MTVSTKQTIACLWITVIEIISEDPKYSKIQIFWGSAPDPTGGGYSASPVL